MKSLPVHLAAARFPSLINAVVREGSTVELHRDGVTLVRIEAAAVAARRDAELERLRARLTEARAQSARWASEASRGRWEME